MFLGVLAIAFGVTCIIEAAKVISLGFKIIEYHQNGAHMIGTPYNAPQPIQLILVRKDMDEEAEAEVGVEGEEELEQQEDEQQELEEREEEQEGDISK